jgi:hypothetical protein
VDARSRSAAISRRCDEVSHALNSGDAKDFALQALAIIGMNCGLFIFDEPPNDNGFLTQFPSAGSYVRIRIQ